MGLIAWLAGAFASALGASVVRFAAWKLVAYSLFAVILPIILNNFVYKMMQHSMSIMSSIQTQYGLQNGVLLQLTGLAAWFATHLKFPEAFAVIMSAVLFRVTMRLFATVRPSLGV